MTHDEAIQKAFELGFLQKLGFWPLDDSEVEESEGQVEDAIAEGEVAQDEEIMDSAQNLEGNLGRLRELNPELYNELAEEYAEEV